MKWSAMGIGLMFGCLALESAVAESYYSGAKTIKLTNPSAVSGVYTIDPDGAGGIDPFAAYCDMTTLGGGWTLAAKMDGTLNTWAYNSSIWTSSSILNPENAGLDSTEFKSLGYSTVPFDAIMLGLDDGTGIKYIALSITSTSLSSLFSGGYINFPSTKAAWSALIGSPRLEDNVVGVGVNVHPSSSEGYATARLGLVMNNEADSATPDAFIGVGGSFNDTSYAAGNYAAVTGFGASPSGPGYTPAKAYLFVRDTSPLIVPEPSTWVLMGLGVLTLGVAARRRYSSR